jgi:SAM-dependent methyltransferase
MSLIPHSPAWYDHIAELQDGYYYPWQSQLPARYGEDVYAAMVREHLAPTTDVLEAACAHGEFALGIAPLCRSVLAYDRVANWIQRAQQRATERGLTNLTFICHDSSTEANGGQARLPAPAASFDLLLCSKGPFHWILDARRVARPGAVLLMLVPDAPPLTPWHALLPEALRWPPAPDPHWARPSIEQRLTSVNLDIQSWWSFDVPETFTDLEQLYVWLSWGRAKGEIPSLREAQPTLQKIFNEYGSVAGVEIRYRRHIWKAVVPG